MAEINWIGALVAAVASFLVGGLWYGPLFGKAWQRENKLSDDEVKQGNMPMIFGVSFVLAFIAAVVLSAFFGADPGIELAVGASLAVGLGWVATSFGTNYLFARRSLALFGIDAGYHTVQFLAMGLILGFWP